MCVQPQLPVPNQGETTAIWLAIERPLSLIAFQVEGPYISGGKFNLKGPEYDPMARWINETPAETPWHEVREYRLAADLSLAKLEPRDTSVHLVPSSTGATACSKKHRAGVR